MIKNFLKNIIIIMFVFLFLNIFSLYIIVEKNSFTLKDEFVYNFYFNKEIQKTNNDFTDYKSIKNYTTGPASLRYLFKYYGIEIDETKLIELTSTNVLGTKFENLKKATDFVNLNYEIKKISINELKIIKRPVIIELKNSKYIVVNKTINEFAYIFDPSLKNGYFKIELDDLDKIWKGFIFKVKIS